jgi:alginate O-acetyltransferase complex protein AlgI
VIFCSPFFVFSFLPLVLFLVLVLPRRTHNVILLVASLFFYAWGNVSYTLVFVVSILMNYLLGMALGNAGPRAAKQVLGLGIVLNLGLLFYFKYAYFFMDNIYRLITFQADVHMSDPGIVMPVGISFFTFHALSYIIDVYRKNTAPQKSIVVMGLYMAFFPQLIAGPIIRYRDIAHQFFSRQLSLEKAASGMQRFIFGFAKKMLVANSLAVVADQIFSLPSWELTAPIAWLGILAYTLQIYFDFSGYSDMAIGLAKIFGFEFPENFNYPYVARSVREFWHRWHITLSTWFRDYLYIPLGGSRGSRGRTFFNLVFVFFCTGFWHGASWNFVAWGLFHGCFLLVERSGWDRLRSRLWMPVQVAYTLLVVMTGWVFFRSETLTGAMDYLKYLFFMGQGTAVTGVGELLDARLILIFIFAILYSFRFFRWAALRADTVFGKPAEKYYLTVTRSFKMSVSLVLFFISLVYLAASTYNPFIYYRF